MHSEYAVEPAAIGADWNTFKYLIEKFGYDKGRLISRMPTKWEKKVIAAAKDAGISDVRMKSLVERLRNTSKQRVVDFGRGYDPERAWLENALEEHGKKLFRAIICAAEDACGEAVVADDCDEDHALIATPVSCDVPRTAAAIAETVLPLAFTAKEIDIIDPYFDIRPVGGDYLGPLAALLARLAALGSAGKTVRIHWRTHDTRPPDHLLMSNAPGYTNGIIPAGFVLQFHEWEQIPGGEDFHDRYVLSDSGGIMVGAGLAAAGPHENATFTLLDDGHAATLRQRFAPGAGSYRRVGRIIELTADGQSRLI